MTEHASSNIEPADLRGIAAAGLALAGVAWLLPAAPALLYSGRWPDISVVESVAGTARLVVKGLWADPASAYPADAQQAMPAATGWWLAVAWLNVTIALAALGAWRRLEPIVARERLGRRPYDPRGARPRSWGRPRDLARRELGFHVGTLDRRPVATDEEAHMAVVAPTRAGKTTRCVIPWLLDHDGPAIVTSTKRDVLRATEAARSKEGTVWIFDPFNSGSARWDPLTGCGDWSFALRQAHWLADSTQDGDSEIARYWRREAAKLLAPLLHAAAISNGTIADVINWLDRQNTQDPDMYLLEAKRHAASRQLAAIQKLDSRNRGTTYMSAGSVLAAYRFPEVLATAQPGSDAPALTPAGFVQGKPQTLYVIAPERDQRLLTPLIVALISSILNSAMERAGDASSPRLRVLLDEAANIAPLHELPRLLAQAAGHGIRFATIWQSIGQLRERYGPSADSILANSTAKLFMGPITDQATRNYVRDLVGTETPHGDEPQRRRPRATAPSLQQLEKDRALLVEGGRPPMLIGLRPWWRTRRAPSTALPRTGSRRLSRTDRLPWQPAGDEPEPRA